MAPVNSGMPRMAAALMPREIACWSYSAIALGALEGGLLGVIVKYQFAEAVSPSMANLAVAIATGAPAFTNLASFWFAGLALGRDKPTLLARLIQVIGLCLLLMAVLPLNGIGLLLFCLLLIAARIAWTGVLTVRAAVWRANYQREWRARVTARIVQTSSLLVAACAALTGFLMEWQPGAFRWAFVLAAVCAWLAAREYRLAKMRRQKLLLAAELAERTLEGRHLGIRGMLSVLRRDRDFRNYMLSMMVFGSGNLMLIPLLVVMLGERLGVTQSQQVLLTSSLPLVVLFMAVRPWAHFMDKRHIFAYRAVHSWFYVASMALFGLALATDSTAWLWPASVVLGAANAGAHLSWNLGHNDFSSDANAARYMAIHVSLTGLRGLVMPVLGIGFYQWLSNRYGAEAGELAMLVPLGLSVCGALIFVWQARLLRRRSADST